MRLNKVEISDVLTFSPIVESYVVEEGNRRCADMETVGEFSEKVKLKISKIIILDIDDLKYKRGSMLDWNVNLDLAKRDISIYNSLKNSFDTPIPLLVFGLNKSRPNSFRAYGLIVPKKIVLSDNRWPFVGTKHTIDEHFYKEQNLEPIIPVSDINQIFSQKLVEKKIYAAITLDVLLHSKKVKDNEIILECPFELSFNFRYEHAVHVAYGLTNEKLKKLNVVPGVVEKRAMPIIVKPVTLPAGVISRDKNKILKYVVAQGTKMHLKYSPMTMYGVGLYSDPLFKRAVNFETLSTYSLDSPYKN